MTSPQRLFTLALLALTPHTSLAYGRQLRAAVVDARQVQKEYDYVIIGGGTAGLTVADRLTEDGKSTVLVIEYGQLSDSASITTVTGGFAGMNDPKFMYDINSVPQVNLRNRTIAVRAGKVVGGSSAVNAMMTIRGTAEDYDRWGSFFSKSSHWSWQNLLPYFKRALNFVPPNPDVVQSVNITYDTSFWGNTSGVYAAWPSYQYPATTAQMEAFRGLPDVPFVKDSGSGQPGVYWYPTFMDPKKVERSYAKTGHHEVAQKRPNYQLLAEAKVNKILLTGTTATGVSYSPIVSGKPNNDAAQSVIARKEVILAAGGIHSPQILQLSGIGPKKILSAAKIDTLVDLPGVGQNFQDHPMLSSSYQYTKFTPKPSGDDLRTNRTFSTWANEVWAANRTGPSSIATGNAAAWLPFPVISSRSAALSDALAAQDHASYLPADTHPTVAAGYRAQMLSYAAALRNNGTAFYNAVLSGSSTNGIIVDLHPLSRGTVQVDPSDPYAKEPLVDYRALTNPLDAAVMIDILKYTRRYYLDNPATKPWAARENSPGASTTTDEQWASFIARTMSPSEFHPVGTCAMMPLELGGVVDEELKVYGVKGLRVVDGSVMPTLVGANTCQTVYAVAEKAADLIRFGAPKV
ncbi:putative GMC oxidoreductase [Cladorrhinum samala]|uniref:GMC oxidoreductase n=1 Tax=Cladorrhinum samala TaxID=585594 RepID=A0AAV9I0V9_9PEZI|nr:putative GMC oxidoreductase [Cladorrhinum samala]